MTFQKQVYRQFTTGFPGDIVRDGPQRANPARIASDNTGLSQNSFGRAYGFNSDQSDIGSGMTKTLAAFDFDVKVGGTNFYGILGHPKHHALYGGPDGALSPTDILPIGSEGEFFDMVTGMVVEIFNNTNAALNVIRGWPVAYVPNNIAGADNTFNIPYGGLVAYDPAGAVPTGMIAIPTAKVVDSVSLAGSATGAAVSTYTIIQLTQ